MRRWLRCVFLLVFPLSVSPAIIGIPPLQAQQAPGSDTNWKKDLLRDAMQIGMSKLQHGNGNRNAGGFAESGDRNAPSPGSLNSDTGSDMHINLNTGAGIGSSDFNGNTASGFTGNAGNSFGNGISSGFSGGMGRPNFSGMAGLGALSQLNGGLSRGLGVGGHIDFSASAKFGMGSMGNGISGGFSGRGPGGHSGSSSNPSTSLSFHLSF